MNNKQVIEVLERMQEINKQLKNDEVVQALDHAINCVGAIEQIKWERDIAIQQLNELGYEFGEKIRAEDKKPVVIDTKKTNKNIRLTAEDFNKALVSDELKAECNKADKLFKADKE